MAERLLVLLLLFLPSVRQPSALQGTYAQTEMPQLLKKVLDEFLTCKYLHALSDAFLFASTQQPWNTMDGLMYLLERNNSFSMDRITAILTDYQNSLIGDPKLLVSELSSLSILQFTTMLRLLYNGRKEQIMMMEVDFYALRMSLEQSPGGNRSLFTVAREKCLPMLKDGHCVDLMGILLTLSNGEFVQEDFIDDVPTDLSDNIFRNLTAVFKDLYDMFSVTAQKAIYKWIILGLQKTSKLSYNLASWITAENLWFLGKYMVHLSVQTIQMISLSELQIFIHYDNATKQLDCVYDIRPGVGRAFLHRINASGFDMANVSIAYRLGLLVCFYDYVHLLDASEARILLHQLIKCNQLRGSLTEVQKLKSQLLAIVIRNQTLNESLGSVSDAVVGLTTSQLESLSASAVRHSMAVLQQVSGWTQSQTMILGHKYLGANKVLTSRNISELGSLICGVDANLFYTISTGELAQAMEGTLLQNAMQLNPTQQHALVSQMLTAAEVEVVLRNIPSMLFNQVPLATLLHLPGLDIAVVEDKQLTSSQAFFLYDLLSRTIPVTDLIRNRQLLKGITCVRIQRMDDSVLIDNFDIFEKNFDVLTLFQINCLAWRYLEMRKMINLPIPPVLLLALPTEYVNKSTNCEGFLVALGKVDLDLLVLYTEKREAIIRKVLQCLSGGIRDEYDVDTLGKLLCHLPPTVLHNQLALAAVPAALQQLQACAYLTADQRAAVRGKLVQLHGPANQWTRELIQDLGSLVMLMSRKEVIVLANKYPEEVLPLAMQDGPEPVPEDFLLGIFDFVHGMLEKHLPILSSVAGCLFTEAPSADAIRKLYEANVYWSAKELQCIDADTFTETVELLGSVKGFSLTQLRALKSCAEQAWGPLSVWKSYHVVSLKAIALTLTEEDIRELDLSSIDTMTALSQQTKWTPQQMSSLLYRFLECSNLTLGELRGSDLAGLGILLCGVQSSHVHLISHETYRTVAAKIGTLPCPLPVLQQLKNTAKKVFGKVGSWNCSVLQEVGIVAAGMSVKEIKEMRLDLMPYLQPQAVSAIPPESFGWFSKEQLQSLGPANALAVTSLQAAQLNGGQLQALHVARDGMRESLSSHIQAAISSNLGAGTVSAGFIQHLFNSWWVCILCSTVPGKWQ